MRRRRRNSCSLERKRPGGKERTCHIVQGVDCPGSCFDLTHTHIKRRKMATIDDSSTQGDGNVRLPVVGPENKVLVVPTELKAGALSLPEVLMQSVTTIAPAIAALFFTPFVVSLAGVTAPLAYPIGFVITLMLGIVLVQFTKKQRQHSCSTSL